MMNKECLFSDCRKYRYTLYRKIQENGLTAAFIGVNPSTADDSVDDATIRKVKGFCLRNNIANVVMLNLIGYRSTDVKILKENSDIIDTYRNCEILWNELENVDVIIPAWGNESKIPENLQHVLFFTKLKLQYCYHVDGIVVKCLGRNKDGSPKHPLMVSYNKELENYYK